MKLKKWRLLFQRRPPEGGNIMVMAAALMVGLFATLALALDSARLSTTSREKADTANAMALAALNAYVSVVDATGAPIAFETPISNEEQESRFQAAVERAVKVAESNQMSARFREAHIVDGIRDLVGGYNGAEANQDGARGRIETGRWYVRRPESCTRGTGCPCNLPEGQETRGCFMKCSNDLGCRSHDADDDNPYPANAVRVTLWTRDNEGVQNIFAGAFGIPQTAIQSDGTAAILPRRIAIVPSLSRMETVESHLPAEKQSAGASPPPSEYAFLCKNGCQPRNLPARTPATCVGGFEALYRDPLDAAVRFKDPAVVWEGLPREQAVGAVSSFSHAKLDYECVLFRSGEQGADRKGALVDLRDFGAGVRSEPQPFSNILEATNQVLQSAGVNAQGGDRVALLGYAREVQGQSWTRTVENPNYNSGRRWSFAAPKPQDPWFQAMLQMTERSVAGRNKRLENGFFPFGNDPYSDLPLAIDTAREVLMNDGFSSLSRNIVVLITSGLSTCARNGVSPDARCGLSYSAHIQSLEEGVLRAIGGGAQPSLAASKIPLFPIFVGANVGPHRLIYRSRRDSNICMDPIEMIESRCQMTAPLLSSIGEMDRGNSAAAYRLIGSSPTPVQYFMPAYYLSQGAAATGGIFLPVLTSSSCPRPGNPLCGASGIPQKNVFEERMDIACRNYTGGPPGEPACSNPVKPWLWRVIDTGAARLRPELQDEQGRIFCDPKCRDARGQVGDLLREFLDPPSILLVEDGQRY